MDHQERHTFLATFNLILEIILKNIIWQYCSNVLVEHKRASELSNKETEELKYYL